MATTGKKSKKSRKTTARKQGKAKKRSSGTARRKPVKRPAGAAKRTAKRTTIKSDSRPKAQSVDQIAQSIASGIKSANLQPGMTLPMVLLRMELKPASDRKILAALQSLSEQGVVSLQPDGSYTVAAPQ